MQFSATSIRLIKEEERRRALGLVDRQTATEILGVTVRTLQRWHRAGIGPQRKNRPDERPIQ
jgi:phage terminase Nu1 subunit (DNA packaging protein)